MKILITGGAGFIAFHLASKLLSSGHRVALLDNFNDFYDPSIKRRNASELLDRGAESLDEVDILDTDGLLRVIQTVSPQAVVHLAAMAGVRPSLERPLLYSQVNVDGTVNLLELAREFQVKSFIFGSSSSIYGGNVKVPFSETDSVDHPASPYAVTKRAGELLCRTYSHNYGMHITCLRFFTVYGPRQRPEMAIHKFAQRIWDGAELPVYGDGSSKRDYTYVDDIVAGIVAALEVNPRYEIFNLGESETTTLSALIASLEKVLGKRAKIQRLPPQQGDVSITYANIDHARGKLGYNPSVSISQGLERFAEWFMQDKR